MKKFTVLIAAGAVAAVMAMPASSAQAGCVDVHNAGDPSWATVCDRQTIAICDADPDGHSTYVHWWPQQSLDYSTTQYDTYGYTDKYGNYTGQFCTHETPSINAWGIDRFQVCIQYEGCSVWKNAG
jgi:hypothetical protein